MFKYIFIVLLVLVIVASGQLLTRETHFLGIPSVDSLSSDWLYQTSDSVKFGFLNPTDIEVLKLSVADHRLVILDSDRNLFTTFKIDQQHNVVPKVIQSGVSPSQCGAATAMCQVKYGTYFEPTHDRIAVVFLLGATVGIYQYNNWTQSFTLERTFSNPVITTPVGIFWASGNFYIVDDSVHTIFRTDSLGNIISQYGHEGIFGEGYAWMSDISGYVDPFNLTHLYVSDAANERVDHLTASSTNQSIKLHSQALAAEFDTLGMNLHETAFIPGANVVGLNRFQQRIFRWNSSDSLQSATRSDYYLDTLEFAVHVKEVCGRLVIFSMDTENNWVLRSYQVTGATIDNPVSYPDDHWTTAYSPIIITDSLHVLNGHNLIIDAGVDVKFDDMAALIVDTNAALTINGTSSSHVLFHAKDSGEAWGGLLIDKGHCTVNWVDFSDGYVCDVCTNSPTGGTTATPVSINNCKFDGTKLASGTGNALRLWGSPTKTQSVVNCEIANVPNGRGLYLYNCYISLNNLKVSGCDYENSYIKQATGNISNSTFLDHASDYSVFFSGAGTTPNFKCCTFENLTPFSGSFMTSVYAASGSAPTFGYEGFSSGVSNTFKDSSNYILTMFGNGVKPIIDNVLVGGGPGGRNDWYQNKTSGKFIYWGSPYPSPLTSYSAQKQYWNHKGNTTPQLTDFYPSTTGYFNYTSYLMSPWGLCGGSGASFDPNGRGGSAPLDDDPVNYDSLFSIALKEEIDENFEVAQPMFHDIAQSTTDYSLKWQAATHILSTQKHLDPEAGEAWIPSFINSLMAADTFAYTSRVYGNRLLANYRLSRAEYNSAIIICTDLFSSGLTADDSLLVSIELIGIEMTAGILQSGGGLDNDPQLLIPMALRIHTVNQGILLESMLLHQLGNRQSQGHVESVIPSNYRLYQNYPNPFNPNTEIRFDIPEATKVQLKVFNIYGQVVTTLIDELRPAGAYRQTWSSLSSKGIPVASSVYIYQLKTGNFVDAKKMVLLK